MEATSVLESIGVEIIGVMSPVSICMFLVVLLVYAISPTTNDPIRTAATLVYLETSSDSNTTKLEGALLNAVVFIVLISLVTFLLVLLYYYNFTNFLKNYMRFSAFFVLASMGGSIFLSIIQRFSIPVDSVTSFLLLLNFSVIGVLSVFSGGIPIFVRQIYMVSLGIIVAAWFTKLPEWTTWVLLVALALYDLVAVLAPGGPLKILVELASSRDEELPALVYEARPIVSTNSTRSLGLLNGVLMGGASDSFSVELQPVSSSRETENGCNLPEIEPNSDYVNIDFGNNEEDDATLPLVGNADERVPEIRRNSETSETGVGNFHARDVGVEGSETVDEEMSPLVAARNLGNVNERMGHNEMLATQGIKLGLGDFVFYSVLVGRAAMYDLMTVYACYLAIIAGLGCTLILLSVCHRALPALPISISLGVLFYFLTRLLMEPFVVGTSTNLMMF